MQYFDIDMFVWIEKTWYIHLRSMFLLTCEGKLCFIFWHKLLFSASTHSFYGILLWYFVVYDGLQYFQFKKTLAFNFTLQVYLKHTKHLVQGQQAWSDTEKALHVLLLQTGWIHGYYLRYLAPLLWIYDSKPLSFCFCSNKLVGSIHRTDFFFKGGVFLNNHNDVMFTCIIFMRYIAVGNKII